MSGARAAAPPIVFINLARDEERRQRMQTALAPLPWPARRLDAVWWNDVPTGTQAQLYSEPLNARQYYKPLANGEKGCYASHIEAWRQLLASDAPALVVLEDDVRLNPGFADVVEAIVALHEPWDMVKLLGRPREKVRSRRALLSGTDLVDYRRVPSMTAGYVISRAGATKLLAQRLPFGRPIDVDLRFWWECDLRVLGVSPAAIALDETSFDSSIWQQRTAPTLRERWRKLLMKGALTLGNSWHGRGRTPL